MNITQIFMPVYIVLTSILYEYEPINNYYVTVNHLRGSNQTIQDDDDFNIFYDDYYYDDYYNVNVE